MQPQYSTGEEEPSPVTMSDDITFSQEEKGEYRIPHADDDDERDS